MTAEEKLARRKLSALQRGIHRIGAEDTTPCSVSVVGIGKTGADVIAQILREKAERQVESDSAPLNVLAVDIGDQDLLQVSELAEKLPGDVANVETVALEVPERDELFNSLRRMREFLKLEYPRYYWNPKLRALAAFRHQPAQGRGTLPALGIKSHLCKKLL